jgi:hypothetical protein
MFRRARICKCKLLKDTTSARVCEYTCAYLGASELANTRDFKMASIIPQMEKIVIRNQQLNPSGV